MLALTMEAYAVYAERQRGPSSKLVLRAPVARAAGAVGRGLN